MTISILLNHKAQEVTKLKYFPAYVGKMFDKKIILTEEQVNLAQNVNLDLEWGKTLMFHWYIIDEVNKRINNKRTKIAKSKTKLSLAEIVYGMDKFDKFYILFYYEKENESLALEELESFLLTIPWNNSWEDMIEYICTYQFSNYFNQIQVSSCPHSPAVYKYKADFTDGAYIIKSEILRDWGGEII